jgi:2-dehydropantoate 2-reductase
MAGPPRTLVLGVGAIGGLVAARLTSADWPTVGVARGETLAALRRGPLRIVEEGGERAVSVSVVGSPADAPWPVELALVCVRSDATEVAARALAPSLAPGAVVLSMQNGVDNVDLLARLLPDATVGGVAMYLGAERRARDLIVRRRGPARFAGGPPGPAGDALEAVGVAVGARAEVGDLALALWTKLIANASLNTVTALMRSRVGPIYADPAAVTLLNALAGETEAVARALGVPLPAGSGAAYVADAGRRLPPEAGTTTLLDVEAGRTLERDALLGAVVREGRRLGVPVPASRACDALLQRLDPGLDGAPSPYPVPE